MSGVELPMVPSARALSSAASSSRRSLHSAGSTASYASSKSQQRHADTDSQDDDELEDDEDDEPHESSSGSGGLWDEVESFLNKPSPSFAALAKDAGSAAADALPSLHKRKPRLPMAPANGNQRVNNRPSRAVRKASTGAAAGGRAIDPKLLQEAFAYAERIQRVSLEGDDGDDGEEDGGDDGQAQQHREADKRVGLLRRDTSYSSVNGGSGGGGPRAPQDLPLHKRSDKDKKKKTSASAKQAAIKASAYGKPQAQRKKQQQQPATERRGSLRDHGEWDATPSSADAASGDGSRKGGSAQMMDLQTMQSLVSNLQHGTSVEELRRELMASQQSMAMSRQVIQEAARSFFHAKK